VARPLLVTLQQVVVVGLIEFCVQWIELLSGTLFGYALMSVNCGSAVDQQ